jgi:hypothetical protein
MILNWDLHFRFHLLAVLCSIDKPVVGILAAAEREAEGEEPEEEEVDVEYLGALGSFRKLFEEGWRRGFLEPRALPEFRRVNERGLDDEDDEAVVELDGLLVDEEPLGAFGSANNLFEED